ncbi:major tail fiber protein [Acidovorax sp. KKS102]|uniref:hypothetical protein n=1 Tax=Acidovorax sp. KKS102 TaxID=358220 RepID=UPI00028ACE99|nr:hypothetical protein [Acidovorax sp. KKS102]AFU45668.1 major tail fiber protein [Acidovorax sp. KKS102]
MTIPYFSVVPSSTRPTVFAPEMDQLLAELNPWVAAVNAFGSAFALGVTSTSTTSLAFGTGARTLTVQPGKGYASGQDLVISNAAAPTERMIGTVTAYDSATGALSMLIYSNTGSGSNSNWVVTLTLAIDTSQFVLPNTPQAFTNKTINLANNTLVATSAQLAAAITDETGTGALLFANSPAMTGTPTAPTAAPGTNTTQLATTAFTQAAIAALVASSPAALDTLNELAAALGNDANFATTVTNALALKAALASPAFTGTPTAPTAPSATDTTQLATTAFVQSLAAGRRRMTAQGAVGANKVVVLNSNGSVSTVGYAMNPGALGPEETPTISGNFVQILNVPGTNKVVLLTTTHLHVGTVDGGTGTTTWGAGTALPTGSLNRICWHPVENVVCMTFYNASAVYLQLGTISGSTISLGTAQSLGTATSSTGIRYDLCHNAHQNKIVVVFCVTSTATQAVAVQVAGGVMTAGSPLTISAGSGTSANQHFAIASMPGAPEVVVVYNTSASSRGIRALTVNATALTARTEVTTALSGAQGTAWMEYSPVAGRFVLVALTQTGTTSCQLITLTGTTASAGALLPLATAWSGGTVDTAQQPFAYDIGKGELVFFGLEATTNYARTASATVSGAALVFGSTTYINTSTSSVLALGYNSSEDKVVFAYVDAGNSNAKTTRVYDTGDSVTNANNWIGITAAAIADGAQGLVITKGGVASGLSGLTTGYTYYIDDLGDLQQTGSRRAGVALSATELFLTGNM